MSHPRPSSLLLTGGIALMLGLSACAERPDLSGRVAPIDPDQPWPSLLDSATLAQSGAATVSEEDSLDQAQTLEARAAALQARAKRLSQAPILNQTERDQLQSAVTRLNDTD
ncbi:hypothetical protein [Celeribacter halophilus]|uniref:hypothetical protein n=1 Tax=Celeribacter halophilus TaxID=576117 RepID=UPI003A8DE440